MSAETKPADPLDASATRLRDAAKWLVASFAAVGAILVAGIQLTTLGDIADDTRLGVAIGAIVVGVGAVIVAVSLIVDVLIPSDLAFEELVRREEESGDEDETVKFVHDNPQLFEGAAEDLAGLRDLYRRALEARWSATEAYFDSPTAENQSAAEVAHNRSVTVGQIIANVLNLAAYERLRRKFRARRFWVVATAVLAAASVVAFALAANPPDEPAADLRGANLDGVDLSGASLRGADLRDMTLDGTNLRGTNLDDANLEDVVWKNVTCPDGTNSDNAGKTCEGHLGE